jgi:uncharacterized protein
MDSPWLFYFLALLSEILGTITGFGSSILFVPLAVLFFDFKFVLGITAVFHVFSNLSKIVLFRKGLDRSIVLKLGIPAIVSVVAGALLTKFIAKEWIELIMNIILLCLVTYLLFQKGQLKPTDANLVSGGVMSGFLAGLIGTGGAIRGLALAAFNLEKNIFIATSAVIDLGVDTSRAVIYIWQGYFLMEFIAMLPYLLIISILGSWIGKLLLSGISQQVFRYIVLATILATTIWSVWHFLLGADK